MKSIASDVAALSGWLSCGLAVAWLLWVPAGLAQTARSWVWRNPIASGDYLSDCVWTGTELVAVGRGVSTSPDGVQWSYRILDLPGILQAVAFSGTTVAAVGNAGTVATSRDGADWLVQTLGEDLTLTDLVWAKDRFVAVGYQGVEEPEAIAATSRDGFNWEVWPLGLPGYMERVVWTGHRLIAAEGSFFPEVGRLLSSADGATWTPVYEGPEYLSGVAAAGARLIAVGNSKTVLGSTNGVAWAKLGTLPDPADTFSSRLGWVGDRFALPTRGGVFFSADGIRWEEVAIPSAGDAADRTAICRTPGGFVIVGRLGEILTSSDGLAWTPRSTTLIPFSRSSDAEIEGFRGVAWNGRVLVAVGDGYVTVPAADGTRRLQGEAIIATSPDGREWTRRLFDRSGVTEPRPVEALNDVAWTGSSFVAVGHADGPGGTLVLTSTNGLAWSQVRVSNSNVLASLVWTGRQLVAVGYTQIGRRGFVGLSTNGVNWSWPALNIPDALHGVAWNGARLVAVGTGELKDPDDFDGGSLGVVYTSSDGQTWTRQPADADALAAVTWTGTQFVAVGELGTLVTSSDGVVWTRRTSGTRLDLEGVGLAAGRVYAMGTARREADLDGSVAAMLTTTDGVTWRRCTAWPPQIYDLAWTGEQMVAVGGGNLLLSQPLTLAERIVSPEIIATQFRPDSGVAIRLRIPGVPCTSFQLEQSRAISGAPWQPVSEVTIGGGGLLDLRLPLGSKPGTEQYYRLRSL